MLTEETIAASALMKMSAATWPWKSSIDTMMAVCCTFEQGLYHRHGIVDGECSAMSRVDARQQAVLEGQIRREIALNGNENEKIARCGHTAFPGCFLPAFLHTSNCCPLSFSSAMQLLFNHYRTTPPEAYLSFYGPFGRDGRGCEIIGKLKGIDSAVVQ